MEIKIPLIVKYKDDGIHVNQPQFGFKKAFKFNQYDFYLMSVMPENLDDYANSYIFFSKEEKFVYITLDGAPQKIEINIDNFLQALSEINPNNENYLSLSNAQLSQLTESCFQLTIKEIKRFCENAIAILLNESLKEGERIPNIVSKEQFLQEKYFFEKFESSLWLDAVIKISKQPSKFPTILKWSGQTINFFALAANSIAALLAIKLTAKETSEEVQWTIGGFSAFLNFLMLMVIFTYSGATGMLKQVGERVTQVGKKTSRYEAKFEKDSENKNCYSSSCKKIALGTGAALGVGALQLITCINNYQDVYSIALRINSDPESLDYQLMLILAWVSTITLGLNNVVFQGYFAKTFVDDAASNKDRLTFNNQATFTSVLTKEKRVDKPKFGRSEIELLKGNEETEKNPLLLNQNNLGGKGNIQQQKIFN